MQARKKLLPLPGILALFLDSSYIRSMAESAAPNPSRNPGRFIRELIDESIRRVESRKATLIIPRNRGPRRVEAGQIFHEYPELFIQFAGTNRFKLPGEVLEVPAGSMVLISPELPHGERAEMGDTGFGHLVITPGTSMLQVHLAEARPAGNGSHMVPIISYYERNESRPPADIRRLVSFLIAESKRVDDYRDPIIRGLLAAVLASVRRSLEGSEARTGGHPLVEELRRNVLSRYMHPELSVAKLAEQIGRSADYISWLYRSESGRTLSSEIRRVRLERAVDMLRETDYQIAEIAWNCGFSSPAYFTRVFTREYGRSPREYRSGLAGG
jgi:AraC-like DNA-binding protein